MKTEQQFALPELVLRSRDDFARWFFELIQENVEAYSYDAFYDISSIINKQQEVSLEWSKISHLKLPEEPHTPWILAIRSTGTFSSFDISLATKDLLRIVETSHEYYIINFSFMRDYYNPAIFVKVQPTNLEEIQNYIIDYNLNKY